MTLFSLLLRLQIIPRFTVFILNLKHKLMHVLAYNCSIVTCPNITRHMIWRQTFLSFHSPGMECFQNWVFTLLCNQLVPLPFQPHCKSLPSLDRQTVPCLEHFSIGVASFLRKSDKNIINSHIHKCKMNMYLPYDTLQICALQLCSEAGKSWDVSSSSGRCQSSLDSPAIKVMCVLLCF